jgi:hypothetical protein
VVKNLGVSSSIKKLFSENAAYFLDPPNKHLRGEFTNKSTMQAKLHVPNMAAKEVANAIVAL